MIRRVVLLGAAIGLLTACDEPELTIIKADVVVQQDLGPVVVPIPGGCQPPGASLGCVKEFAKKVCDPDGTGFVEVACPAGNICLGEGVCTPAKCVPGTTICLAPDKVGVCAPDGSQFTETDTCSAGLGCVDGECVSSCATGAKAQTNVGCNYALVDLGNFESGPQGKDDSDKPVVVVVSNTSPTEDAHLEVKASSDGQQLVFTPEQLTVPPQNLTTFTLPRGLAQLDTSINRGSWFLTSDQPVTVHLINPANGPDVRSNDATLLFPTDALGNDYLVMGWRSFWTAAQGLDEDGFPQYGFPSYVTIIATSQGATEVTVTPTADIRASKGGIQPVDALAAGKEAVLMLQSGDVLNLALEPKLGDDHDLTGTRITSTKALAVFAAHNCAFVPSIEVKFCDHLEHQLTPIKTWAKTYVADQFAPRAETGYDVIRIMASQDQTKVTTDPGVPGANGIILDAGEWVEYQSSFTHLIQATAPVQVGHYMTGSNIEGFDPVCGDNLTGIGDPAFTIGVGLEQYLDEYIVLTPEGYTDDWLNVVKKADTNVVLDGMPLELTGEPIGNTTLELIRVPVADGVHRLEADAPFGVTAYGYDCDVSYAYPGGMLLKATEQEGM